MRELRQRMKYLSFSEDMDNQLCFVFKLNACMCLMIFDQMYLMLYNTNEL